VRHGKRRGQVGSSDGILVAFETDLLDEATHFPDRPPAIDLPYFRRNYAECRHGERGVTFSPSLKSPLDFVLQNNISPTKSV
jgi:hypothetical protein